MTSFTFLLVALTWSQYSSHYHSDIFFLIEWEPCFTDITINKIKICFRINHFYIGDGKVQDSEVNGSHRFSFVAPGSRTRNA